MKVITVFGQKRNGKDCVADYLALRFAESYNQHWERTAFANPVKDLFCDMFEVSREFIEEWKEVPTPPPGFLKPLRQGLQFIGDGFRTVKSDIWVSKPFRNQKDHLIISDGRYLNEAVETRKRGGFNILVYRPGFLNDDPNGSEAELRPIVEYFIQHQKTGPIDLSIDDPSCPEGCELFDFFIWNDREIRDLYDVVSNVLLPDLSRRGHLIP